MFHKTSTHTECGARKGAKKKEANIVEQKLVYLI
jgi:hypothetical protein